MAARLALPRDARDLYKPAIEAAGKLADEAAGRAEEHGLDQINLPDGLDHPGSGPGGIIEPLSVVVPVHNEAEGIVACDDRLHAVLAAMPVRFEIIYVNDGSVDQSLSRTSSSSTPISRIPRN